MLRHEFLAAATAAIGGHAFTAAPGNDTEIAALESHAGGRLGVYALDTKNGQTLSYRANERFPMCSTFKLLAVSAVLANVDAGREDLKRRVGISKADLLAYAPVTEKHVNSTMSIADLCAAAIEWSDNTAANLLLHAIAGPGGVTRYARVLGDRITRLDRDEPSLNSAIPGDPRDTTTPQAMAHDLLLLANGKALKPRTRELLKTWLLGCRTGHLKTGFPASWRIGDKTGSGDRNTVNDVAIVWPPNRPPLIVTVYFTGSTKPAAVRDAVFSQVARLVSRRLV